MDIQNDLEFISNVRIGRFKTTIPILITSISKKNVKHLTFIGIRIWEGPCIVTSGNKHLLDFVALF